MKTILYHEKFSPLDEKLTVGSGNMNIMPGDRVLVGEDLLFKNDIDTPWRTLLRSGTVINRYGILAYTYDERVAERYRDGIIGPYEDYLEVEMDEVRPTGDKKNGCFTWTAIKLNLNWQQFRVRRMSAMSGNSI